jgi:hypothetical protein
MSEKTAVLVEGETDVTAVRAYARRFGRDLDADGVRLVPLGGGGGLNARLRELGPAGRGLRLLGLCDADHERRWARWLEAAGMGRNLDRDAMEALGFFVCDPNLELELVRAVGIEQTLALVEEQGETTGLRLLSLQPAHRDKTVEELMAPFLWSRKASYPKLLIERLPPEVEAPPLARLLERI